MDGHIIEFNIAPMPELTHEKLEEWANHCACLLESMMQDADFVTYRIITEPGE